MSGFEPVALPVPDGDDAEVEVLVPYGAVSDEQVEFRGSISKLGFNKFDMLEVTLSVDMRAPVSNLDLLPLRSRQLRVVLQPVRVTAGGHEEASSATEEPVLASIEGQKRRRIMEQWFDLEAT